MFCNGLQAFARISSHGPCIRCKQVSISLLVTTANTPPDLV